MTVDSAAFEKLRAHVERLQTAYRRVFGGGATKEDRVLVLADLEVVCNVRQNMLREKAHATSYEVGKFSVWQRINNMRFPRPADVRSEFKVTIQRDGGNDEQDERRRPQAGPGVAEPTED
jgi:hypothetical protein